MTDEVKELLTNMLTQAQSVLPRIEVAIQDKQTELNQLHSQHQQVVAEIQKFKDLLKEPK